MWRDLNGGGVGRARCEERERRRHPVRFFVSVLICLSVGLGASPGQERPRSILVIDQSNVRGPFYYQIFSSLRATIRAESPSPIAIYGESLDLSRFSGPEYEDRLQELFRTKYRDKDIAVIVAIGSLALEHILRWRPTLWPGIPVVFSFVDEPTIARLTLPPDVTGGFIKLRLSDMMTTARAVVPGLKTVVFVGNSWESQTVYRHWKDEIPIAAADIEVTDLTGLALGEVRQRVASLPDHAAILYTSIYSDGVGMPYLPAVALALVAETANRPIVVTAETFLGQGGIGGFVITPSVLGQDAARRAMRVLGGEPVSAIPLAEVNAIHPVFDWNQMQRWRVSEASLPAGSEIRFRELTAWDQYRGRILAICAAVLFQAGLIAWLLYERQFRHRVETLARDTMSELTQMNRIAAAGELSASIAHEINQPLTGIVTRASAARRWLAADKPDVDRTRAALDQIISAGHRAAEIIRNARAMFRKDTQERSLIDVNRTILTVLAVGKREIQKNHIDVKMELDDELPRVVANEVQLQQVILNLIVNAVEAMHSTQPRILRVRSALSDSNMVHVSVEDSGTGIDPVNHNLVFKPLFTTKSRGMGMGLSICHSIIGNHDGRIWVTSGSGRGSVFQFELPASADKRSAA